MKCRVFLDSGAFSVARRGVAISVDTYGDFLERVGSVLDVYASLDVIPKQQTPAAVEDAAKGSWSNYKALRKRGFNPLPVFHIGERFEWLERMVGESDYVGLGGIALLRTEQRREWLDTVFTFLAKKQTTTRVHGLGIADPEIIVRYPWTSTDAFSWTSATSAGTVLIPVQGDFSRSPLVVHCAEVDAKGKRVTVGKAGFRSLGERTRKAVLAYIENEGFSYEKLSTDYRARGVLNAKFFLGVEKTSSAATWGSVRRGLFECSTAGTYRRPNGFTFYFVQCLRNWVADCLVGAKATARLISFAELVDGEGKVHKEAERWVKHVVESGRMFR